MKSSIPSKPKIYDSFESEFLPLLDELRNESDRGIVLICASFMDDILVSILKSRFVLIPGDEASLDGLLGPEGILSSFGARIRLAFHSGAIDLPSYKTLQQIRKLRNIFAHARKGMNFGTPSAADACGALDFIEREQASSHRTHFVDVFVTLALHLTYSISLTHRLDAHMVRDPYVFRNMLGEETARQVAKDGEAIPDNSSS